MFADTVSPETEAVWAARCAARREAYIAKRERLRALTKAFQEEYGIGPNSARGLVYGALQEWQVDSVEKFKERFNELGKLRAYRDIKEWRGVGPAALSGIFGKFYDQKADEARRNEVQARIKKLEGQIADLRASLDGGIKWIA